MKEKEKKNRGKVPIPVLILDPSFDDKPNLNVIIKDVKNNLVSQFCRQGNHLIED